MAMPARSKLAKPATVQYTAVQYRGVGRKDMVWNFWPSEPKQICQKNIKNQIVHNKLPKR